MVTSRWSSSSRPPGDTLTRAVEAAVRSAGGGDDSPSRPIAVGLPSTDAGAAAAKVFAGWLGGWFPLVYLLAGWSFGLFVGWSFV